MSANRGVARIFVRGGQKGVWGQKSPSGVQGQSTGGEQIYKKYRNNEMVTSFNNAAKLKKLDNMQ